MATELFTGTISTVYANIFETCSSNSESVDVEVFKMLLQQCSVDDCNRNLIWNTSGASQGCINRTNFYKTLALIAWTQQGRTITEKSIENSSADGNVHEYTWICERSYCNHLGPLELPIPEVGDLKAVRNLKFRLHLNSNPTELGMTYNDITSLDCLSVELVPEKKGIFIKHSEYMVSSRRFNSKVTRRYNDFFAFFELLLVRFPYRIIPRLPPKRIVSDSHFLEARRRGLHRWVTLVCRHPIICHDQMVAYFLTEKAPDLQHKMREIYRHVPDEFMTSDYAATAQNLQPQDYTIFANNRAQVSLLVQIVGKIKSILESEVERSTAYAKDFNEFSIQLRRLGTLQWTGLFSRSNWTEMRKSFSTLSSGLVSIANHSQHHASLEAIAVCDKLQLLLDVLLGHRDLCERLEKGLAHDHQTALQKMLALKKRKIQGVIRDADFESVEQLESKMLAQESVITSMELRSNFSLYCIHMETQLVHSYLETLSVILNSLISLRVRAHTELAESWMEMKRFVDEKVAIKMK